MYRYKPKSVFTEFNKHPIIPSNGINLSKSLLSHSMLTSWTGKIVGPHWPVDHWSKWVFTPFLHPSLPWWSYTVCLLLSFTCYDLRVSSFKVFQPSFLILRCYSPNLSFLFFSVSPILICWSSHEISKENGTSSLFFSWWTTEHPWYQTDSTCKIHRRYVFFHFYLSLSFHLSFP